MKTLQHTAVYTIAFWRAFLEKQLEHQDEPVDKEKIEKQFKEQIPWLLLPDGIRAYIGPRQMSHFEQTPDGTGVSAMVFPTPMYLDTLTKESSIAIYFEPEKYPKCVIGEATQIGMFDELNSGHQYYRALRCHLLQDIVLDEILRQRLVDVTDRFEDEFRIRHTNEVIDGAKIRQQISLFEDLGFIRLVGHIYERTGVLLNKEWFDANVFESLKQVYPLDLAESTYNYMRISDELDARLNAHNFTLTEQEKSEFILTNKLEEVLDEMYEIAIFLTIKEVSHIVY